MVSKTPKMPGMVTEPSNPDEHLLPARHTKGDRFIRDVADAILKDIWHQMKHPFHSLSKKPKTKIRRYEHNGNYLEMKGRRFRPRIPNGKFWRSRRICGSKVS